MTVSPMARHEYVTAMVKGGSNGFGLKGGKALAAAGAAVLLHPPLILVGVSMGMERGCQLNGSLADG